MSDARQQYMALVDRANQAVKYAYSQAPTVKPGQILQGDTTQLRSSGNTRAQIQQAYAQARGQQLPQQLNQTPLAYGAQQQSGTPGLYSPPDPQYITPLPPVFQKASIIRQNKGEIKPPSPPKESMPDYIAKMEAQNRRRFLSQTRAKFEYEQALANYRYAVTQVGRNVFANGTAFLDRIPTPGNLKVPFLVLFILFFVLVPVNGHTRIGWLWLTFLGDTDIGPNTNAYDQPLGQIDTGVASGGGGGGIMANQEWGQATTGSLKQIWQSDVLPSNIATGYNYMSLYGGEYD